MIPPRQPSDDDLINEIRECKSQIEDLDDIMAQADQIARGSLIGIAKIIAGKNWEAELAAMDAMPPDELERYLERKADELEPLS